MSTQDEFSEAGRQARFERWEKLGLERVKSDLLSGGHHLVGGPSQVRDLAWEWVRMKEAEAVAETQRDSFIEPKPPAMLQHFAWILKNWRRHKLMTIVALALIVIPIVYGFVTQMGMFERLPIVADKAKRHDEDKKQALRVTFRDGTVGYVGISVTFAADRERAAQIIATYGSQENAINELMGSVIAATYQVLETLSITEARQNRDGIATSILNLTKEAQRRTGHLIQRFSILEIDAENEK